MFFLDWYLFLVFLYWFYIDIFIFSLLELEIFKVEEKILCIFSEGKI